MELIRNMRVRHVNVCVCVCVSVYVIVTVARWNSSNVRAAKKAGNELLAANC